MGHTVTPALAPAEETPAAVRAEVVLLRILVTAATVCVAVALAAAAEIEAAVLDVNNLANNTPAQAAAPKATPPATK